MLIDVSTSGDRNMIKIEAEKILKKRSYSRNTAHVECKKKGDTINNRWRLGLFQSHSENT